MTATATTARPRRRRTTSPDRTPGIGSGLILPIAKIMGHLSRIHAAIRREWPMTIASVATEWNDVIRHLDSMYYPTELITEETFNEINGWDVKVRDFMAQLQTANNESPEDHISTFANAELLQTLIEDTWNIFHALDREAIGLSTRQTDAGTLP